MPNRNGYRGAGYQSDTSAIEAIESSVQTGMLISASIFSNFRLACDIM